jgi:glucose/arabinose dehydrogenase
MRRLSAFLAGPLALSLVASAAYPQEPPQPRQGPKPVEHAERFGTTSSADQLGDASCGTARNAADDYYAPPAFPDQSRAPRVNGKQKFKVEVVTHGIKNPWAFAFLPDGKILLNVKTGGMVTADKNGVVSAPLTGTPAIVAAPLSAMYDLRLDKDFAKNRTLYFGYVTKVDGDGKQGIGRVVRAKLSKDDTTLTDLTVIHEMVDFLPRRIVWAADNTLFVTGGEVNSGGPAMQSVQTERGKVLRINTDGSIPKDNPFLKTAGADPALYAVGFRDQEGAQINPATGELWTVEDEPRGGDELNIIKAGHNYGFPVISYGRENNGALINGGKTAQDGMDQPIYFWTPSIAPSGMTFYTGKGLPGWTGSLFVGALSGQQLIRLEMKNGRVVGEEKLLRDRCKRIRDVRQGPDGLLYLITDDADGEVLRLAPVK